MVGLTGYKLYIYKNSMKINSMRVNVWKESLNNHLLSETIEQKIKTTAYGVGKPAWAWESQKGVLGLNLLLWSQSPSR